MKKWGRGEFWGLSSDFDPDFVLTDTQKKLLDDVRELCRIKIKPLAMIKTSDGLYHSPALKPDTWTSLKLKSYRDVSNKMGAFVFTLPNSTDHTGCFAGQYISVRANIKGKEHTRYFSPVSRTSDYGKIELVMRFEKQGIMSNYFKNLKPGQAVDFQGPCGGFEYQAGALDHLTLLASGGGITPNMQLVREVMANPNDQTHITLLYFSENCNEILFKEELDKYEDKRLNIIYTLGEAPDNWEGEEGFIDTHMIDQYVPKPNGLNHKIVMCGGPQMILSCLFSLHSLGFPSESIFVYGQFGTEQVKMVYGRKVRANIKGKEHTRYFSPVSRTSDYGKIELVMRFEKQGIMSNYFKNLKPGEMAKNVKKVLSERGAKTASHDDFLINTLFKVSENLFHPTDNPKGIVNLGTAVNTLMSDKVCERMRQPDAFDIQPHHLLYFDMTGTPELKEAVGAFLNRHFHPLVPVLPSQVVVMSGVTSCLDALGHALCDPGDIIITPTPVYGRIITDFRDVTEINIDYLNLSEGEEDSDTGNGFTLRVEDIENRIKSLKEQGLRVGAVILLNPHNPLGDVYPPHFLLRLLDVCAQHKIHAIVDEVYALSVFKEGAEFHSVLSLDVPDPRRTHVLWGMSKDFGNAGMRVGVVVTRSKELLACLQNSAIFKGVPSIIQQAASVILNDIAWSDEYFLPTQKQQLRATYEYTRERLVKMGVIVRDSSAGLFIWFSVQRFLKHKTKEEEIALHKELLEAGVYTVPGFTFYCITPGWMRIIFSIGHQELKEGLDRLEMVLKRREPHITNGITNGT